MVCAGLWVILVEAHDRFWRGSSVELSSAVVPYGVSASESGMQYSGAMTVGGRVNPTNLVEQYSTPDRLAARADAHRRYSEQPGTFDEWVIGLLDVTPSMVVADVGSGFGLYHPALGPNMGRIVAIDSSPGMLKAVAKQAAELGLPVETLQANAERIPLPDACCDRVMCNHVLYHISDIKAALRELKRIARPGGRVIAATNATGRVPGDRFTLDHFDLFQSVFPGATLHVREDAFRFPTAEDAQAYFETMDLLDDERRQAIDIDIAASGIYRVPKTAGCFVSEV